MTTNHTVSVLASHPRDDDGLTDTSRTVHRARCSDCRWRSVRNLARTVAEREAQKHAQSTTAGSYSRERA